MARKRSKGDPDRRPFKEKLKDLGDMHAGERRGFFLLMIIMVCAAIWVGYVKFVYEPPPEDISQAKREMELWVAHRKAAEETRKESIPEPFPFDPNTIERNEWVALGLTDRQVDGIERFVSKGGQFKSKKDVERMYTISAEQYQRLEPFILLPDSAARKQWPERKERDKYDEPEQKKFESRTWSPRPPLEKVEINAADSLTLIGLPGIGPSFAKGILKFRDMLGGFHSLDQLNEVYVLRDKPDALLRVKELLFVNPDAAHKVPINSCTVEELAAHPYARWKIAKPLIAYRTQHGPFQKVEDIRKCLMVTDSVYMQLAPYLRVDD